MRNDHTDIRLHEIIALLPASAILEFFPQSIGLRRPMKIAGPSMITFGRCTEAVAHATFDIVKAASAHEYKDSCRQACCNAFAAPVHRPANAATRPYNCLLSRRIAAIHNRSDASEKSVVHRRPKTCFAGTINRTSARPHLRNRWLGRFMDCRHRRQPSADSNALFSRRGSCRHACKNFDL
jgi:hypothetical protein